MEGVLEFPAGAEKVYYAVANATPASLHLADIRLSLDVECTNIPAPPSTPKAPKKDGGCNAAGQGFPVFSVLVALLLMTRAWRRIV